MRKLIYFIFIWGQVAFANNNPEYTASMWKYFFPNSACEYNECARNVPFEALQSTILSARKLAPRKLAKAKWIMVIDFSQHSLTKRAYLINTQSGQSEAYYVAHGWKSDNGQGYATMFSNNPSSYMSSLGLYSMGGTYVGKHGPSLILNGLESTNSNAGRRKIVIHGADYMNEAEMVAQGYGGRSEGCPAFEPMYVKSIIDRLKGDGLLYMYAPREAIQVK